MRKLGLGMFVIAWIGLLIGNAEAVATREVRRIYFTIDRAEILPESQPALHEVAELLRANPDLRISLVGNTCDLESNEYNLELSRQRADNALTYLMDAEGITRDRVNESYVGEADPRVPNVDETSRAMNRRVVMTMDIPSAPAPEAVIRTVTTSVEDVAGNFIPDLTAEQFVVREAGQRKEIVRVRSAPVRFHLPVGLLLDSSNGIHLTDLREAVRQFLGFAGPADRFLLADYGQKTRTLNTLGGDRAAVLDQLDGLSRPSGMRLYDAVAAVSAGPLASRAAPRYLIIFSDGVDEMPGFNRNRDSTTTLDQAVNAANLNGVHLITVGLGPITAGGQQSLQDLARRTDGKFFVWDQHGPSSQFAEIHRLLARGGGNGAYTIDYLSDESWPAVPVVESTVGRIRNPR